MEEMTHKGALTAGLIAEYIEKGLVSEDSLIAIALNGVLPLVDNIKVGVGESKSGSRQIIILQPRIEDEPEEMSEEGEEQVSVVSPLTEGIDFKKAEELSNQILRLLQNEPSKEIVVALCFCIARVMYKCIPNSDDFVPYISNLVGYFYNSHKERETKNEQ